eukprot:TRINITY_DN4871_c1_g1_i1.p1 TRINITY_DN4871_c1_g1~~TRINITY_DN4871_c1_g1_i1.p1  ORF type:complete len:149 (-),score=47.02 TRINITY_DN4871_c1_g1_i1:6-452(-)
MTKRQLRLLREQFESFDVRGTGYLGKDEVLDASEAMGLGSSTANDLFSLCGTNDDGQIHWPTFLVLSFTLFTNNVTGTIQYIFSVFSDDDGLMTNDQFRELFDVLMAKDQRLGENEQQLVHNFMETETFGKVSYKMMAPVIAQLKAVE